MVFHPWRALRDTPELFVDWRAQDGLYGTICGEHIIIGPDLTQAERRCTLVHEMVHHKRGVIVGDGVKEEHAVDNQAARLLIPLEHLIEALLWAGWDDYELAEYLWVDQLTVQARIDGLTEAEHETVNRRVYEAEARMP